MCSRGSRKGLPKKVGFREDAAQLQLQVGTAYTESESESQEDEIHEGDNEGDNEGGNEYSEDSGEDSGEERLGSFCDDGGNANAGREGAHCASSPSDRERSPKMDGKKTGLHMPHHMPHMSMKGERPRSPRSKERKGSKDNGNQSKDKDRRGGGEKRGERSSKDRYRSDRRERDEAARQKEAENAKKKADKAKAVGETRKQDIVFYTTISFQTKGRLYFTTALTDRIPFRIRAIHGECIGKNPFTNVKMHNHELELEDACLSIGTPGEEGADFVFGDDEGLAHVDEQNVKRLRNTAWLRADVSGMRKMLNVSAKIFQAEGAKNFLKKKLNKEQVYGNKGEGRRSMAGGLERRCKPEEYAT